MLLFSLYPSVSRHFFVIFPFPGDDDALYGKYPVHPVQQNGEYKAEEACRFLLRIAREKGDPLIQKYSQLTRSLKLDGLAHAAYLLR